MQHLIYLGFNGHAILDGWVLTSRNSVITITSFLSGFKQSRHEASPRRAATLDCRFIQWTTRLIVPRYIFGTPCADPHAIPDLRLDNHKGNGLLSILALLVLLMNLYLFPLRCNLSKLAPGALDPAVHFLWITIQ